MHHIVCKSFINCLLFQMALSAMQVHRGASTFQNMLGLICHEAKQQELYFEPVGNSLVIWPKAFGHLNGIQKLDETSVGIYTPIEQVKNHFKVSLWALEVLIHARHFINSVNPHARKIYAVFSLKSDIDEFLQTPQCAAMRLGVVITEGILHPMDFKSPYGVHISEYTEVTVNCCAEAGTLLWKQLQELSCYSGEMRRNDLKVKLSIQKPLWWQLTLEMLLDDSKLCEIESALQTMGLPWKSSTVRKQIFCLDESSGIMEKLNIGLKDNYSLTSIHSTVRSMNTLPNKFTPQMLQAENFGGGTVKIIGIPLSCLSSPILSELIFAAVEETEDYWAFLKATQDDRQIEPDSVVGIILSALMSKL